MSERKKKQDPENGIEVETEENDFVLEPTQIEVGSGYALAIHYDENQRPMVAVKTYGQVDLTQVKREILKIFPDAQIKHTNQTKSVKIVRSNKGKSKK
ncbi:hypothetical protein MUP79_07635 [Candidatus Bathyarchaeota archaeon]|jgi:hypothetical protein|nr:hypothetical protein [Candidatus Bathyarchaeota archaeon]